MDLNARQAPVVIAAVPGGRLSTLVAELQANASLIQDVLDAAHCIEPLKTESVAMRLLAQDQQLTLNILRSIGTLVESLASVRAAVLLAQE
jgi:hypothetical protein